MSGAHGRTFFEMLGLLPPGHLRAAGSLKKRIMDIHNDTERKAYCLEQAIAYVSVAAPHLAVTPSDNAVVEIARTFEKYILEG